jgi:4-hydroxy-tetrahydrodipicolinate synthase
MPGMPIRDLSGVYAAAVTPLHEDFSPDLDALPVLLDHLARSGCHGALLLGTTGEGPSFAFQERLAIFRAGLRVREVHPDFRLLAGIGTPSLEETIALTRTALELGFDAALALPPYYYRRVSDDGLFAWFDEVLKRGVPAGGRLLAYHIPAVSGVSLSMELVSRLGDAFPDRFAGLKDSSADPDQARLFGERFGGDLAIFNGTDPLFLPALEAGASGCITAPANLFARELRQIWDAHQRGEEAPETRARVVEARSILDRYPPAPALLKTLLWRFHGFARWPVRPPLLLLPRELEEQAAVELENAGLITAPDPDDL